MHLLLVEDDVRLAKALRRLLQEEGHVVDVCGDGRDALVQVSLEPYDVVLLDVMLPGLSGYRVARQLRASGSMMPILMLTARDAVADRVEGLDSGADDYLVKPFSFAELSARIRALDRRARMAPVEGQLLSVGDLELDLRNREVRRGDHRSPLTAKEFALLEALMRNPNRVLSRGQLLDRAWSLGTEVESNVVDTYIHYLRKKVDEGFATKLIKTVRGAGYRLEVPGVRAG